MLNLLTREAIPDAPTEEETDGAAEFEIVVGKRQIAGLMFLATVVLAVFSATSYMAGEATSPRRVVRAESVPVAPAPAPIVLAPIADPPPKPAAPESPLFGQPNHGDLYLQMGAIEKGLAAVFAEGLRTHGFEAFVAPGPSDKIFRVLIGPLADHDDYQRTKDALDDLGLTTFARKYEQ